MLNLLYGYTSEQEMFSILLGAKVHLMIWCIFFLFTCSNCDLKGSVNCIRRTAQVVFYDHTANMWKSLATSLYIKYVNSLFVCM